MLKFNKFIQTSLITTSLLFAGQAAALGSQQGPSQHTSQASKHSAQAVGHSTVAGMQVVSAAVAVPVVAVGASVVVTAITTDAVVKEITTDVSKAMSDEMGLHISDKVVTQQGKVAKNELPPSPKKAMQQTTTN
ncbi:hypothetical protein DS2_03140 [Catenovulum agarivorans DS-2]|uniref:Uncharacterized protein n=1 Tax=Catenovulum agarivorans DS-2 TaxID=1328313 RepID=W7R2C3_9ALTE|nr:hypothetical protein [Catenovulum agarivorans]EWH11785.1 hypothetical protein DS2_03140 [Catenovulum agarivorans DS-2]